MIERLSLLGHYARARREAVRWHDRAALERWQERYVRRHLARVAERSPFFRELAREHGIGGWRTWPTTDKAVMMERFDDWNTAGVKRDDAWSLAVEAERSRDFTRTLDGITVGLSSGTSGSRGLFLASPAERRRWAGMLLARVLRGTLLHEHRAALFLRADSPLYQTVGSRRFRFEFFDLMRPIEEEWPRLVELRPTVLAAPPAVLAALAAQPGAARLLQPPAILLSVADVLDADDRARIEAGFGHPVGQIYQATEGFLAATCAHGSLHWNEDAVVIQREWLDEARTRYVPVVTDFRRLTQPIVRYRLDDVIVEAGDGTPAPPCPCGSLFATLGAIEGRCDDALRLPGSNGGGEVLVFPDFVRRAVVMGLPAGVDYTVRQTAPDRWDVALSQSVPLEAVRREIARLATRLGARPPTVEAAAWTPSPPHTKRRRVRREIA